MEKPDTDMDFGIVGGSGFYRLAALEGAERHAVETPFGAPSAKIVTGRVGPHRVAFLARHGEDHQWLPHRVNYRANIWALHHLRVRKIIGINAVGGIRDDMAPRAIAVPDQIIDYTHGRASSFCDVDGAEVRHVDFSEPYSPALRQDLLDAAAKADVSVVDGGCYGATQGPRLETRAEIARMRRDGCDLVGMTGMPEAVLARELAIDYACVALVANWAAGCDPKQAPEISVDEIFAHLEAATAHVPTILENMAST